MEEWQFVGPINEGFRWDLGVEFRGIGSDQGGVLLNLIVKPSKSILTMLAAFRGQFFSIIRVITGILLNFKMPQCRKMADGTISFYPNIQGFNRRSNCRSQTAKETLSCLCLRLEYSGKINMDGIYFGRVNIEALHFATNLRRKFRCGKLLCHMYP